MVGGDFRVPVALCRIAKFRRVTDSVTGMTSAASSLAKYRREINPRPKGAEKKEEENTRRSCLILLFGPFFSQVWDAKNSRAISVSAVF